MADSPLAASVSASRQLDKLKPLLAGYPTELAEVEAAIQELRVAAGRASPDLPTEYASANLT
jgi:hypothetical protein